MNVILASIALLFERFFDWSHFRRWFNFRIYLEWVDKKTMREAFKCAAWIFPLPLLIAFILYFTSFFLFGALTQLAKLMVFMYCLGPSNFWVDSMAARTALQQNDPLLPDIWKKTFNISGLEISKAQSQPESSIAILITHSVRAAYERLFAPLIGFLLFGVVAAVFYRVLCLSLQYIKQTQGSNQIQSTLEKSLQWIDAIPLRLMALFLLFFSGKSAQAVYKEKFMLSLSEQNQLLSDMALLCVKKQSEKDALIEDATLQVLRKILDWVFALALLLGLLMWLL